MEEDSKPFIFEKREIALIFICMILIAFLSFSMGVKVGKSYSFKKEGFVKEDREKIKLKSELEESIEAKVNIESEEDLEETKEGLENFQKLRDELKKVEEEEVVIEKSAPAKQLEKMVEKRPRYKYAGKYTIQLGTYRSEADSRKFADGFSIRGYEPIIQEIDSPGKGLMYRVSLGVFDSKNEALEYVKTESSLFRGQDYLFTQFE
jgi:cell division septation protein DedD